MERLAIVVMLLLNQHGSASEVSFSRDIRPILSNHCFACHGPDEDTRESDLRLDMETGVAMDMMLERITSSDEDLVMPPPHANKPLSENQISTLSNWIADGAPYETHWSFLPIQDEWSWLPDDTHPIDFLVQQHLAKENAMLASPADPATLVRRVSLDLIGLPPSDAHVDRFLSKPTDATYHEIVDELLASEHYGQRWARRWLDLARYADTNGYEKDRDRTIWPYRDWVIHALNADMPFDQFTIEQLAGDMLPNPTRDQLIATGFHRNTMLNEEGGVDPLEFRYYAMVDRVATTGKTWLGLTTECAQCHTHKYDPITHENYFGFMAYLDNADEVDLVLDGENSEDAHTEDAHTEDAHTEDAHTEDADTEERAAMLSTLYHQLQNDWMVANPDSDLRQELLAWLTAQEQHVIHWTWLSPEKLNSNLPSLQEEENCIVFVTGDTTKSDRYELLFPAQNNTTTHLRLETFPDARLPGGGPGLTYYEGRKGEFFLSEVQIVDSEGHVYPIASASETFSGNGFGNADVSAAQCFDGDVQTGWAISGQLGSRQVAIFELQEPIPAGVRFSIEMTQGRHFASSVGKFRWSSAEEIDQTSSGPRRLQATTLTDEELDSLDIVQARLTNRKDAELGRDSVDPITGRLLDEFLLQQSVNEKTATRIRELENPAYGITTLIFRERTSGKRRKTYLRHRGEFTQPDYEVSPHLPEMLRPISKGGSASTNNELMMPQNRLEFARWIVSDSNPLTARVVANRHWAAFFGDGIVPTLDDFGMQGIPPRNLDLLDFLAHSLKKNRWSIKQLHRMIVTSRVYRQSSTVSREDPSGTADVRNRQEVWLSKFPRRRLDAEILRDTLLSISGLLDQTMCGPPVRPPQPIESEVNFSRSKWKASEGKDRYRRSIYTYQKRTAPFAMFTTFDAGSGETCLAKRDVSNTPLQALTLLNDPMFVEYFEAFGERMQLVPGSLEDKIDQGFRWALVRRPETEEQAMLADFFNKHQDWTALARVIMCLDETICQN